MKTAPTMFPLPMPKNCEADDDARQVLFDLEFWGTTWRAAVSYEALARMFSAPRQDAAMGDVRESRQQVVRYSKAIARFVIQRITAGAVEAERIIIV